MRRGRIFRPMQWSCGRPFVLRELGAWGAAAGDREYHIFPGQQMQRPSVAGRSIVIMSSAESLLVKRVRQHGPHPMRLACVANRRLKGQGEGVVQCTALSKSA